MAVGTRGLPRFFVCAALITLAASPALSDSEKARATEDGRFRVAILDDGAPETPAATAEDAPPTKKPDIAIETLRQAIELYRKGDVAGGDRIRAGIGETASRALTEWLAIRFGGAAIGFNRIVDFIRGNPTWPTGPGLRRRAE